VERRRPDGHRGDLGNPHAVAGHPGIIGGRGAGGARRRRATHDPPQWAGHLHRQGMARGRRRCPVAQ
jgi:hypothetical protein